MPTNRQKQVKQNGLTKNMKDHATKIGYFPEGKRPADYDQRLQEYANIKLAAKGCPTYGDPKDYPFLEVGKSILANIQEKSRLLSDYL